MIAVWVSCVCYLPECMSWHSWHLWPFAQFDSRSIFSALSSRYHHFDISSFGRVFLHRILCVLKFNLAAIPVYRCRCRLFAHINGNLTVFCLLDHVWPCLVNMKPKCSNQMLFSELFYFPCCCFLSGFISTVSLRLHFFLFIFLSYYIFLSQLKYSSKLIRKKKKKKNILKCVRSQACQTVPYM